MAVGLRDRRAEALPQLRLQRVKELALPLQVVRVVEMQAHLDDAEVRGHRPRIGGSAGELFEGLLDLLGLEELEDVVDLHVLVAVQHDPALEALLDLLDVVLEAA